MTLSNTHTPQSGPAAPAGPVATVSTFAGISSAATTAAPIAIATIADTATAAATVTPTPAPRERVFTATDSPCVAVCSTLFDDICRGCGRTAMEVSNWVSMNDEEKQRVWVRIRAEGYPRR